MFLNNYGYILSSYEVVDPEILKRKGALCRPPWLAAKEILGFRWSKQAKITLETNFFGKTFLSLFSNFLHFNESMPMKSYQVFKIYIRFYKKRDAAVNEKRKPEKIWTSFYLKGYFMTLKMAINHFFLQ